MHFGTGCALSSKFPTPVTKFPFDVSRKDSVVNELFQISKPRYYIFSLQYNYSGREQQDHIRELIGGGGRYPDGRYGEPGVIIPIHIIISKIDLEKNTSIILVDQIIDTQGKYVHGFEKKDGDGFYEREIIITDLEPGVYRVEANTIKDLKELSGTTVFLKITWRSFN